MDRSPHPLAELGAAATARAIATGELTALDAVEQAIARIDAADRTLHAVVARRADAARAEARALDARRARGEPLPALAGVPITVKDSIDVAGFASTFGLPWRKDSLAERDDPHVARLRAHGAIVVAKTNVAQLLLAYESDNPLFGRTLHPMRADRSPGGSSGGEAALVAARASTLGIGTDIGGSVRIPAHFCGIAAFKPTTGRCEDPGRWSVPAGLLALRSQIGVLGREVDDLVLALRLMEGGAAVGVAPLADPAAVDVAGLRVGWFDDDGVLSPSPAIRRAVAEAAAALRGAGAQVTRIETPSFGALLALALRLLSADGGVLMRGYLRGSAMHKTIAAPLVLGRLPKAARRALGALLRAAGQPSMADFVGLVGRRSVAAHWEDVEALQELRAQFDARLAAAGIDVLLAPPCAVPAYTHGAAADLGTGGSYAMAVNALGWPAGVVPWTVVGAAEESDRAPSRDRVVTLARRVEAGSAGLPVGVQVIARAWQDHLALAAMRALERAGRA